MVRIISLVRHFMIVFLVVITVFVIQAGGNNTLRAQAEPVTPEAKSYQVNRSDTDNIKNDNKLVERSRKNLKETADDVREKLDIDEANKDTKDLLNSFQQKIEEVVKPITGKEQK